MCLFRSGCNTVPIEKGTETDDEDAQEGFVLDRCNTVPIEKGTETKLFINGDLSRRLDATPSPSRRGLKLYATETRTRYTRRMQHRPHREGD